MNSTPCPFTPGERVTRNFDGAAGTVESVSPWDSDTGSWAIAVRLDKDGEVWSGTEVAWAAAPDEAATADEVEAMGLDSTGRFHAPYTKADLARITRERHAGALSCERCADSVVWDYADEAYVTVVLRDGEDEFSYGKAYPAICVEDANGPLPHVVDSARAMFRPVTR